MIAAEKIMPGLHAEMLEIQFRHGIGCEDQKFLSRRQVAKRPPGPQDRHGAAKPGDVKLRHRV